MTAELWSIKVISLLL